MIEEGTLLYFNPFEFKNGATPKAKYFIVLANSDEGFMVASLPTSKDFIPSDILEEGYAHQTKICKVALTRNKVTQKSRKSQILSAFGLGR